MGAKADVSAPCELLAWDSQFFGFTVARVSLDRLTSHSGEEILNWCAGHHVDCLYYKMPLDDQAAPTVAQAQGFDLVDVRIEMTRHADEARPPVPAGIRVARASDIPQLQSIAARSHTQTRFYADQHFRREACDALYRTWITRSCEGYADAVLVAEDAGRVVGYVTVHLEAPAGARIGLLAVADNARGAGVGTQLVGAALGWCAERDVARIVTATQARNAAAIRLYERCGFLTSGTCLWYHRWFARCTPAHDRTANSI